MRQKVRCPLCRTEQHAHCESPGCDLIACVNCDGYVQAATGKLRRSSTGLNR